MGSITGSSGRLRGKVALITGGSRGIGKGIALELAREGASIGINYRRDAAAAEETVQEIIKAGSAAFAVRADVTSVAEISQMFEEVAKHFGRLDIVVSNSGTEVFMPVQEVTTEVYDRIFALNTKAQFFVAQQAYKHLPKNGGGRIILTSSVAATLCGIPDHAIYAGSKAAIGGFVRSFAKDYGSAGITVNAIAPGGVKTDMYKEHSWHYVPGGYPGMPIETIDQLHVVPPKVLDFPVLSTVLTNFFAPQADFTPLGRVGLVEDIARVVAYLASPESEWINSQVITLSGGAV